jgi:hypothetical protein
VSVDVLPDLTRLAAVDLDELNDLAALQTRTDRKYVIGAEQLDALVERVGDQTRVLDIDGRRTFGYESVYFDTPRFDSYLGAAHRRPNRFKVRRRTYLETGGCTLEVKLRSRRGQTVKHRQAHTGRADVLDAGDQAYLRTFGVLEPVALALHAVLRTRYERTTMIVDTSRVTIDLDVTCSNDDGAVGLGDRIVVETKSDGSASIVDRALWSMGHRPATISKYGIGIAALHPDLPHNKWHRVLRRHVHPLPSGSTPMR